MPIQKITSGVVDTSVFSAPTISSPIISGNLSFDSTGTSGVRLPSANTLTFATSGAECMRIDSSGNLLVGSTAYTTVANNTKIGNTGILNTVLNGYNIALNKPSGDPQTAFQTFFWNSSLAGYIAYNGSGVSYSSVSDARLKENVTEASSGLKIVKDIAVRSYDWVNIDKHEDFGFVAQELFRVYPEAVTKQENKENGEMDMPWGVDYSKLVPLLTKAIQEQNQLITDLTTRLVALENT